MAESNVFDPAAFLDYTADQPNVRRPPLKVGDYLGVFEEPEARTWVSSKDPTKSGFAADYQVSIEIPPGERERLGLERDATIKCKYGIMLDTMPDGKTLDMGVGKNAGLRRLREALDMNKPGDRFNLRLVAGRVARFKIGHREYPEGSGDFFEDIVGISKA